MVDVLKTILLFILYFFQKGFSCCLRVTGLNARSVLKYDDS